MNGNGERVESLRKLARVMDTAVRIPGTRVRFGLDAVLGLLPGAGDVASGAVSLYSILVAARLGAPRSVLVRMATNIVIDSAIGTIPLLGDLFDVGWKANTRNVALLDRYTLAPQRTQASSRVFAGALLIALILVLAAIATVLVLAVRGLLSLI